jgi:hypothetical protein
MEQPRLWTVQEYLAFERTCLEKHELIDGRVYRWGSGLQEEVPWPGDGESRLTADAPGSAPRSRSP